MDIVERLRTRAEMQTATGISNSENHIDWIAADEIERLRKVLQEIADKDGWCSAKAVAKRLREAGYVDINTIYKMAEAAADEIEFLRKERNRLREALKIFAIYADYLDEDYGDYPDHYVSKGFQGNIIVFGDFRKARAALKEGE